MEADFTRWLELAVVAGALPLVALTFRWARRVDRKVEDALHSFKTLNERLEQHDQHLEEVVKVVTSELGGDGVRDRLTKVEQRVEDLVKFYEH